MVLEKSVTDFIAGTQSVICADIVEMDIGSVCCNTEHNLLTKHLASGESGVATGLQQSVCQQIKMAEMLRSYFKQQFSLRSHIHFDKTVIDFSTPDSLLVLVFNLLFLCRVSLFYSTFTLPA